MDNEIENIFKKVIEDIKELANKYGALVIIGIITAYLWRKIK